MYQSCWTAVVRAGTTDMVLRARRVAREALVASQQAWDDLARQMACLAIEAKVNATALSVSGTTMKLSHRVAQEMASQQKMMDDASRNETERQENGEVRLPGLDRSYDLPEGIVEVLEGPQHGK